jgi:hypothetical protein
MVSDRIPKHDPARPASTRPTSPGLRDMPTDHRRHAPVLAAGQLMVLQQLAGNRATTSRVEAAQAVAGAPGPRGEAVQRLDIYGRAAAESSALPADVAAEFERQIDAHDQAAALRVLVAAMTARGELDPKLLRTSGEGELWEIRDVGDLGAAASFRASFPDPDDATHRLPNPRFGVSPALLSPGHPGALERLHSTLLHEYRHVEQQAERVNRPRETGRAREPGYGNDPDEFDAYLSEVESAYSASHMRTAALQAGVGWEFLADADKEPFRARWTAAQARIQRVLGRSVEEVLRSPAAERYRAQLRDMAQRAREAMESHAH